MTKATRNSKNSDLTKILKPEHAGKWVALNSDRSKVVGFSESFQDLEKKVGRSGIVFMRAAERGVRYAF